MNGAYLCPNCGCTEAIQKTVQDETVTADENGEPEHINVETVEVIWAECQNCGKTLIE